MSDVLKGIGGHHRAYPGTTDEWWTPASVFVDLGLDFDLDPASPLSGPVPWIPAARFLTARDDGLARPWRGRVWLNPPYGNQTGRWIARLAIHGCGIALVFARTDTRWFHEHGIHADALCFVRGRLEFIPGNGQHAHHNSGGPSLLLAWGSDCASALERSGLGSVCRFDQQVSRFPVTLPLDVENA